MSPFSLLLILKPSIHVGDGSWGAPCVFMDFSVTITGEENPKTFRSVLRNSNCMPVTLKLRIHTTHL